MQKTKLVVFDIDGTLTDTVKLYTNIYIESLKDLGITKKYTTFKGYKHHTDSYIGKSIFEENMKEPFSIEKLEEFEEYLTTKCISENIEEIKGAKEQINFLESKTNYGVCFATGSLFKPAEYKLKSIGLSYAPNLLIASNNIYEREGIVGEAIEQAKQHYKVENFERIISVGDGVWDLKTAKNLNIEFIGIGKENKDVLEEAGCSIFFEDYTSFYID